MVFAAEKMKTPMSPFGMSKIKSNRGNVMTRSSRGFSLIEMLAVVLLVGLIATGTGLIFTTGGPKKDLESAIEQFTQYGDHMGDLSILTGEPLGLVLTPPQWSQGNVEDRSWVYRWKRFIELPDDAGNLIGSWEIIENLEPIAIDKEIELFVRIDGSLWDWDATPPSETPLFVTFPSGEVEPLDFEVEFVHSDSDLEPQHAEVNQSGKLEWRETAEYLKQLAERLE